MWFEGPVELIDQTHIVNTAVLCERLCPQKGCCNTIVLDIYIVCCLCSIHVLNKANEICNKFLFT